MHKIGLWQVVKLIFGAVAGFAVLMMVAVLGLLVLLAGMRGVTQPTSGYLPVTGTVVDHRVHIYRGHPTTSSRNQWDLEISVAYIYSIEGTNNQGRDFLTPMTVGSKSEAEQLAADQIRRYAKGAAIEVFYDPRTPSKSALERHSWLLGTPALLFGVLFLGGALGLGVIGSLELLRRLLKGPGSEPWRLESLLWRWLKRAGIALVAFIFVAGLAAGWSLYPAQIARVAAVFVVFAAIVAFGIWREKAKSSRR